MSDQHTGRGATLPPEGSAIGRLRQGKLREWIVPALFLGVAVVEYFLAGLPFGFVAGEVMTRIARDSLFTLALVIPIVVGLGLNFSVVIGALGGQVGLIVVNDLGIGGLPGIGIAVLIGVALGYVGGIAVAWCMERAPGREMIVGIILGFLADGVYRIIFMAGYGTIIPAHNAEMVLSRGIGLRDTVDFAILRRSLDLAIPVRIGVLIVPVATLLVVALTAWALTRLLRSRRGQHLRAVGMDPSGARLAGLDPKSIKRFALIVSTVVAAVGQVIWLQNIGMLQTYSAHRNVGFLASAALLAGGATVRNARIRHALVGTAVFHAMFVLSPLAGQAVTGSPAIGEFFRSFVTYGTIAVALVVTGWVEAHADSGDLLDKRLDAGP